MRAPWVSKAVICLLLAGQVVAQTRENAPETYALSKGDIQIEYPADLRTVAESLLPLLSDFHQKMLARDLATKDTLLDGLKRSGPTDVGFLVSEIRAEEGGACLRESL